MKSPKSLLVHLSLNCCKIFAVHSNVLNKVTHIVARPLLYTPGGEGLPYKKDRGAHWKFFKRAPKEVPRSCFVGA